jgi:hypothetical protein
LKNTRLLKEKKHFVLNNFQKCQDKSTSVSMSSILF